MNEIESSPLMDHSFSISTISFKRIREVGPVGRLPDWLHGFYWPFRLTLPRCMECRRRLATRILCSSFRQTVHCDKMEERSVQIFIPYERSFSLVFEKNGWRGDHFDLSTALILSFVYRVDSISNFLISKKCLTLSHLWNATKTFRFFEFNRNS